MFPAPYFVSTYFPVVFFPTGGSGVVLVEREFGGRQFIGFMPLAEMLKKQLPVDAAVLQYTQESETEFIIDGKKYELVAQRTPKKILDEYPQTEEILQDAAEKMGISRRKAKKELYNLVIDSLKEAEDVKQSIFADDEEILMILVATDEI